VQVNMKGLHSAVEDKGALRNSPPSQGKLLAGVASLGTEQMRAYHCVNEVLCADQRYGNIHQPSSSFGWPVALNPRVEFRQRGIVLRYSS
jgi:hypothetical protein